jgi:hypothetical protein
MSSALTGKKKEKDTGQVIMGEDDDPMCSLHGYSLWIEEKNVVENNAFCMTSDEIIDCAPNTKLANRHISLRKIPDGLEELSGLLHEVSGEGK